MEQNHEHIRPNSKMGSVGGQNLAEAGFLGRMGKYDGRCRQESREAERDVVVVRDGSC